MATKKTIAVVGATGVQGGVLAFTLPMGDKKLPGIAAEDIGKRAYGIFKGGRDYLGQMVGIAGAHPDRVRGKPNVLRSGSGQRRLFRTMTCLLPTGGGGAAVVSARIDPCSASNKSRSGDTRGAS